MKKLAFIAVGVLLLFGCKKDIDDEITSAATTENGETINLEVQDFIWKGLNVFYLWQADVTDLADTRFAATVQQTTLNNKSYYNYLNTYASDPKVLFDYLRYSEDRFSYITDNYTELENSFQGVSLSTGMEYRLSRYGSSNEVLGYVRYVLPNTSAEKNGIERGDIFLSVDGTALTLDNYYDLLFNDNTTITIEIYRIEGTTLVSTGRTVTLDKAEITENPVYITKIIEQGDHKIGYLMYNGFVRNFDTQLNTAFGELKAAGITDLVVDLRYNGGGAISSAIYLGSMITGQFTGQIFAKERWNDKLNSRYGSYNYFVDVMSTANNEAINSLNLDKVYILATGSTASASELVINGLKPYIDVVQIGTTTVGKNQGSITIYDWIDNNGNRNPNHKWAMQPIVLKIENAAGVGDYTSGLTPNIKFEEDIANFGVLGQADEPFLAKAIQAITGEGKYLPKSPEMPIQSVGNPEDFKFRANEMYSDKVIELK